MKSPSCWALKPDVAIQLFRYLQAPHFILSYLYKKRIIDIHEMLERDWMVEVDFLHRLTGINIGFFNNY
ncbi:hypothetical protein BKP57_10025 [Virgibacillus sp. 6R]|nr:hypothetical protein BKP57_10025 [Virgibacillus sp. 6R]